MNNARINEACKAILQISDDDLGAARKTAASVADALQRLRAALYERSCASYLCCPMCDMDAESPKGQCPGRFTCNEITQYLNRTGTASNGDMLRASNEALAQYMVLGIQEPEKEPVWRCICNNLGNPRFTKSEAYQDALDWLNQPANRGSLNA